MSQQILIVGKHGKTGRRVNSLLQANGYQTKAVSRSTEPAFDWLKPENWREAMRGCNQAYVCYQPDLAVPQAELAINAFLTVAKQEGIQHIVLLSGRGEDGAQQAEQQVINSGLTWNIVRASWFAQNFSEGFMIDGILNGEIALPASDIPEPFIDVDDIAEVAYACITSPKLNNQLIEITGPHLLTFKDCVEIISEEIKKPIHHTAITVKEFLSSLQQQNMPEEMLWLMNELFSVVMDGRNSQVTHGVETLLGRPATSFREYARKTAASGAWSKQQQS